MACEVAAVGVVECWRRGESESVQRAVQKIGRRQRHRSTIKGVVGRTGL